MESIGLTPHDYAISMADALAFLYWIAKVDANDVEFVLAQPRSNDPPDMNSPSLIHSDVLGTLAIWILDFDCCNDMTLDESGIERAADAFGVMTLITHDRAAQMPLTRSLWEDFRDRFLRTSERILKDETSAIKQLPRRLIERITQTRGMFSRG